MKRIVLTGGGTAGHVTPNHALLPELKAQGYDNHYIGSKNGIEKDLIKEFDIPYYGISSGKLRRYFDVKNFTDPFRVLKGCQEAASLIKKVFGGSRKALFSALLEDEPLSEEEINELRKLIDNR